MDPTDSKPLTYSGVQGLAETTKTQRYRSQEEISSGEESSGQSSGEISEKDLPPSQRQLYKIIRYKYLVKASLPRPELVEQYQREFGEDLPQSLVKLYDNCAEILRFRNGADSPKPYQHVFNIPKVKGKASQQHQRLDSPKVTKGKASQQHQRVDSPKATKGKASQQHDYFDSHSEDDLEPGRAASQSNKSTPTKPPSKRPEYRKINQTYLKKGILPPLSLIEEYHNKYNENLPSILIEQYNSCAQEARRAKGRNARLPKPYQPYFTKKSPTARVQRSVKKVATKSLPYSLSASRKGKHSQIREQYRESPSPSPDFLEDGDRLAEVYQESLRLPPDQGLEFMRDWWAEEQAKIAAAQVAGAHRSFRCTIL